MVEPTAHVGQDKLARWPGRDQRIMLADGRAVMVRHYGCEGGDPIVMLHGTPGSRILFAAMHALAEVRGQHIIALDRYAYGGTDAPQVPTLAGFAADVDQVADRLHLGQFAIAGVSGGGPYATACAVGLPKRVAALGLISPVGLVADATRHGEVDVFHRFCFHVLPRAPRVVETAFKGYASAVRRSAGLACGLTTFRAPRADKTIMADCATSARLLAAFDEGLSRSARGPAIDLQLFREVASLDLPRAKMPACLWIGDRDRNVPVTAAQRLARALPRCDLINLADVGHLWIAHHYETVLDWVAATVAPSRIEPTTLALPANGVAHDR